MEEREEGEISEGELSDISSEEEYLLRQRLQVLESYNHVLERKEAKRRLSQTSPGHQHDKPKKSRARRYKTNEIHDVLLQDLSDISDSDLENSVHLNVPRNEYLKVHKKKPSNLIQKSNAKEKIGHSKKISAKKSSTKKDNSKNVKLNTHKEKHTKCKTHKKPIQSSDESDDEYRNKRRRLEQSVKIDQNKADLTSLKMRLLNMFSDKTNSVVEVGKSTETDQKLLNNDQVSLPVDGNPAVDETLNKNIDEVDSKNNLCENDNGGICIETNREDNNSFVKDLSKQLPDIHDTNSDDDIDILRQLALQTQVQKEPVHELNHISDSEDSDELRIICLRSKVLKNKMEWRRKVKMRKRLERLPSIDDILENKLNELTDDDTVVKHGVDNTDVESVDMEIGVSDGPDTDDNLFRNDEKTCNDGLIKSEMSNVCKSVGSQNKPDDLEEDEDLLRAKLLTSLSNKLQIYKKDEPHAESSAEVSKLNVPEKSDPEPKKFIIHIGESDSGSENETTKNLTKMHIRLAENVDFQQKLDVFLKNARKEAENKGIGQESSSKIKSPEKFIPKAVNHLPLSGQLEYKLLVKRMADLERIKHNRQAALNRVSKNSANNKSIHVNVPGNKTKIVSCATKATPTECKNSTSSSCDLEMQIALSRKRIAAESTKVLRLKEEASKLTQKYKMVAIELRNIRTAMSLNKREVAVVQSSLAAMRHQHQLLLKRSTTLNPIRARAVYGKTYKNTEVQANFENNKNTRNNLNDRNKLQAVTVSVVNNLLQKKNNAGRTLAVKVDLTNNKKSVVSMNKELTNEFSSTVDKSNSQQATSIVETKLCTGATFVGKKQEVTKRSMNSSQVTVKKEQLSLSDAAKETIQAASELDDYTSPLASMKINVDWNGDPNGILCPFDVLGACKDSECRYQHPAERL